VASGLSPPALAQLRPFFTAEAPRMITEERGFDATKTLRGAEPRAIDEGQRKLRAAKVIHYNDLP